MSLVRSTLRIIARSIRAAVRLAWNTFSLVMVLSVAATIPVLQFASLGYMLECSARVASGAPIRQCFPGIALAGHIVRISLWVLVTWLPIWLLADLGYSSELIQPGSSTALRMRVAARVLAFLWVLWILSAIERGGRWKDFLWPKPIAFLKTITRRSFWGQIENRWWEFLTRLQLWRLIKLGFQASLGALIWLAVPGILILISLNAAPQVQPQQRGGLAILGFIGAVLMARALQYLPTLQTHMAVNACGLAPTEPSTETIPGRRVRLGGVLDRSAARGVFRLAPIRYAVANILFLALALPLYLLRIESIPQELWFLLSIFFVIWMFPAKLLIGWLIRRSALRTKTAFWPLRWVAWSLHLLAIGVYVGFLYLGKFALWEGGAILLLQHAFLPPSPFYIQ